MTLLLLVLFTLLQTISAETFRYDPVFATDGLAKNCDYYLAPSTIGGWGVYAGRDFQQGEIVELIPRFLVVPSDTMHECVLDDYCYGFTFQMDPSNTDFLAVIFGAGMWFNHGPGEKQNVVYTNFGREPDKYLPWASQALAYVANRDIQRGEELLSSYGETNQWFVDRGLEMAQHEEPKFPSEEEMERLENKYCSALVAGIGHSGWNHRIAPTQVQEGLWLPELDLDAILPLQDHPTAVAKKFVAQGETLEMSPALVVPAAQMERSPLSPMVIYWDDLDETQQQVIKDLREFGAYRMKGKNNETGFMEIDVLQYYEESSILPAAGKIGLVKKVGNDNPNCKIDILASVQQQDELDIGSTGLVLKLVALTDIQSGEELRLNLPDNSSWDTKIHLQQQLALLGQPIPSHIVDVYNTDVLGLGDDEDEEPEF